MENKKINVDNIPIIESIGTRGSVNLVQSARLLALLRTARRAEDKSHLVITDGYM